MARGGCASRNRQDGRHSRRWQNDSEVGGVAHDIVVIRLWGCLTLAGLLLAGCSFKPGGSASDQPSPDASGGFSDGLPDPDGGPGVPDGAHPLPDSAPVEPVLLETLTIPVTSSEPVESSVVLVAGQSYRLVASGTAIVRVDDVLGRFDGDADYWFNDVARGDTSDGVDLGLAVNDDDGTSSRTPDWGEYTGSHVYEATIPGDDNLLSAVFFDPDYDNGNSGSLTLEIWGPP